MDITEFTIRLLLLFFPGIICSYIVDTFTMHKQREPFFFLIQSFVLGLSSYFLFWIVLFIGNKLGLWNSISEVVFLRALINANIPISYSEIAWVCFVSIILGLIITVIETYKIHFRLIQTLKISNKFGELDVWGYSFNAPNMEWVTIRDTEKNLVYDGWVQTFSDDSKNAELLLRDVSVYSNSEGTFLYQVGAMYISRNRDDITIEFRTIPITESRNMEKKEDDKDEQEKADSRTIA
ncbi:hypothetical protein COX18_00990 [Candidatus Desantisbacteria bacterium CG23_combo_of_CG06-09_8_20_14_all_40_23]|uniref:Uncharacterized protein n=1 Tax=Candidatus Desantisbacteria bacterium CG23_combo_of_CG06-09_8_20_14_all_40_23 TaxID=1974550 RepID=A0A2H0ABN0_9BACT|nr:MAG: hypothetical protein COX18_00990 [Candidatus Desantisbacteria bacterium CG23_combo_of_CG06-09_8_20_14_all_40_23]